MKDETRQLAIWLTPATPAREFFQSLIDDLARRYDAPHFEPHLTLNGRTFDDSFRFDALDQMRMPASIVLEIGSIQHSEKYTKTLFVRFKQQPELVALRAAVARILDEDVTTEFDPHLSLLYKTMPETEKLELADGIELPFDRVCFEGMKAISTPAEIQDCEGVRAWHTVWEHSLG